MLPCEARLAAKQTDIGRVEDPRYHYRLKLRNEVGIKARPMRLRPEEEAWLDVHLDELALVDSRPDLRLPVRIFGDSQLLIRFMLRIYKKPQQHTIYWVVEDVK